MPLYSYYCAACDEASDRLSSIDRRDQQMCSECGFRLLRGIDKPGMVWSPTRNGGFST